MPSKTPEKLAPLKRKIEKLEEQGYLLDCWVGKYKPGGTAGGDNYYYHLRSREPLENGKLSMHLPEEEVERYRKLVKNGREFKKVNKQIQLLEQKKIDFTTLSTNTTTDEWYTPPEHIKIVKKLLKRIDVDPCSIAVAQKWIKAKKYYAKSDNGLSKEWKGKLWMNPPFGAAIKYWIAKALEEYEVGNITEGVILTRTAVGSRWYNELNEQFVKCEVFERIQYLSNDLIPIRAPIHGSTFFYLGERHDEFYKVFSKIGVVSVPYSSKNSNNCHFQEK